MEVSNTIFNPSLKIAGTANKTHVSDSSISFNFGRKRFPVENLCFTTGKAIKFPAVSCSGFTDSGHVEYYLKAKKKDGKEKNSEIKEVKKKLKVFKRFSRDMAMVSDMAVAGAESENQLFGEVKGKMISEAMEILQKQLRQMKAEQKEIKKKKKAEMKLTMPKSKSKPDSSSSSSSSECDTVISTRLMRASVGEPAHSSIAVSTPVQNEAVAHQLQIFDEKRCDAPQTSPTHSFADVEMNRKVEVCMGGKCKKMGAVALFEEFEKEIGNDGEVVGCKCMGKCKSAPNVRLKNHVDGRFQAETSDDAGSVKAQSNPLFIGVSLEDVSEVVSTFLGKQGMHDSMVVAPA